MPKGILEFNLEDREENKAFKRAVAAGDSWKVIWDMNEHLRQKIKYTDNEVQVMYLEPVKEFLQTLIDEYQIDLSDY